MENKINVLRTYVGHFYFVHTHDLFCIKHEKT